MVYRLDYFRVFRW